MPALACNRNIAVCSRRASSHGAAARNKPAAGSYDQAIRETIGHPVNTRVRRREVLLTSPDPGCGGPERLAIFTRRWKALQGMCRRWFQDTRIKRWAYLTAND
jgi:hypothetical protein